MEGEARQEGASRLFSVFRSLSNIIIHPIAVYNPLVSAIGLKLAREKAEQPNAARPELKIDPTTTRETDTESSTIA